MKALITGSEGFIGKNLKTTLSDKKICDVICFDRKNNFTELKKYLDQVDVIFHLAGVNRSNKIEEFNNINFELTKKICNLVENSNRNIPIFYSSSIQAGDNSPYGISKEKGEKILLELYKNKKNPILIFRLPNVFGKWSKPNYNSVVATFCNNVINNIDLKIENPNKKLDLLYIDDLIDNFIKILKSKTFKKNKLFYKMPNTETISVKNLALTIKEFNSVESNFIPNSAGKGFIRKLYATFLSYKKPSNFSYKLKNNIDSRGNFVEFLKTKDSGQFSFFTAFPGITRGGHYHHTKNEKFLVVQGKAKFRFKNISSSELYEICVDSNNPEVVYSIPGWAHDITAIGNEKLIVILWSNEIFDELNPDTYSFNLA